MLLMFGVGLHFSVTIVVVRRSRCPGAVVQMPWRRPWVWRSRCMWGWSLGAGLIFGLSLSVASTVVLLEGPGSRGLIDPRTDASPWDGWWSRTSRWSWCWSSCPPLAGVLGGVSCPQRPLGDLEVTLGQVGVRRPHAHRRPAGFPWLLWHVTKTGSRELFTLCVVAAAVSDRLRFGRPVRRVLRARRLPGRNGAARVRVQPSRGRGNTAAAGRFRGAVLRLGGMLFDPRILIDNRCPCWRSSPSSSWASRLPPRRSCCSSAIREHGPHRFGQPGADRRVLLHSRRARHVARTVAEEGQSLIVAGA